MSAWGGRLTLLLSLLLVVTTLPGCWDYESINRRAPVIGIGIDPVQDDPEQIEVTIQYPELTGQGTSTGGTNPSNSATCYQTVSAKGYSFEETLRRLQLQMDREIDVAQVEGVVFSAKLSSDTMDAVVAQLIRHQTLNLLTFVYVARDSAKTFLKTEPSAGSPVGTLYRLMSIRQRGYAERMRLWEYWRDATQIGVSPMLPIAAIQRVVATTAGSLDTVVLDGTVVYSDNAPVYELTPQQTLMINMLQGYVRNMSFDYRTKEGVISLMDVRAHSKLQTVGKGKDMKLIARVKVLASLDRVPNARVKPIPLTDVNAVEQMSSQYLAEQILETVEQLQRSGTDILGFGRRYLHYHPEEAQGLRHHWPAMFRAAKVQVKVQVRINSKGSLI